MTSPIIRAAGTPKLNPPTALMLQLDAQGVAIDAELDRLRANGPGIFKPATDRVRELRRQLADLEAQFTAEFNRSNPEWVAFWADHVTT